MASEQKKLFKYFRDLDLEASKNKRLFFYRCNRWRFDPFDYPRPWRSNNRGYFSIFRLRYMFALFAVYRVTLHYIIPPTH